MRDDEAKVPSEWVTVLSRPQDAHNEATIRLHPGLMPLTFEGPAATFKHFCGDLAALNWQDPSWESQGDALVSIFLAGKNSNNEGVAAGSLGQLSAFEPRALKAAGLEIRKGAGDPLLVVSITELKTAWKKPFGALI